jgi:hypothetical protein
MPSSSRIELLVCSSSNIKIVPCFYWMSLAPSTIYVFIDRAASRLGSQAFFANVAKLFLSRVWFIIGVEIHSSIDGYTALCWSLASSSVP